MEYTVYRLENVVTKKNYIGMTSLKPKKRWGSGYTGKMKEAIDAFPFDLCWKKYIEFQTPNKNQALELEAELMKWYDSVDNGYNTSEYGSGDFKHHKHSEEARRKMSEAQTGEKNHMFGMTGEKHPNFGKHHSEESKNKIRENTPSKPVIQYSMNGELIAEFPSVREASRQIGCHCQSICACCKGKYKSACGYIWKYKEG